METSRLFQALEQFRKLSSVINRLDSGNLAGVQSALELVVHEAVQVIPGIFVEIYAYDPEKGTLEEKPVVSGGKESGVEPVETTIRLEKAALALERQHPVLSHEERPIPNFLACFPLTVGAEALGVLYAGFMEARQFFEEELLILESYANLAAMALSVSRQSAFILQEQSRKERELRRLRRAAMLISSRSNLKETLDAILDVALDITDAIYGVFRLVDRTGKNLVCMAISGAGLEYPAVEVLPMDGHSIMATVASRREPVVVSDLREEPWRDIYYPLDHKLEMRSEVAVPLIGASGRLEGVLNLESPQVAAFDKQDRYILQTLASQAVVAIQEARLLDALQEISILLPRLSRQAIYQKLVERACDLLNVPYGMIWLLEKDQLVCYAASDPEHVGLHIGVQEGLAGAAVLEARPVTVRASDSSFLAGDAGAHYPDLPSFKANSSALAVPLFASPDIQPLGVFSVYTTPADPRDFDQSDWDKKVLDILGHYAALALQLEEQQVALRVAQDQRALTEAFAAIGDIAANLLHRLNNKIGTIPVRIEGIQDKSAEVLQHDPYLARNLESIQQSAAEAMEIVRESLFLLHPVQLAPVSILDSIRRAVESAQLPEDVRLELDGLDPLPPVLADSTRLALVFHNLLENASDAMDGKGTLKILGMTENDRVLVRVTDSGPGIAPQEHERIFEFNYSARTRSHPGRLGFGLWWVKSLMARFGGSVAVESDGQNGAAFLLSLPVLAKNAPNAASMELSQ